VLSRGATAARDVGVATPRRSFGLSTLLSFSWMLFVMQLAIVLADQRTDRLVLAAFVGAAAVGLYDPRHA
jgi:O-antigen/teichoic acid export membrane protein